MALTFEVPSEASDGPILIDTAGGRPIAIPDAGLLFSAEFARDGRDLVLRNDGSPDIRVVDYFDGTAPADLVAPDGSALRGATVERLAGPEAPGQYAQAGAQPGGTPIGQVESLSGEATVQHSDGTVETLTPGSKIFVDDVVQTGAGGRLSITFVDGTIFTLSASSRMVIDNLIYDPASQANTGSFDLIQGGFVFIAGQVARTGGMEVTTPAATMGIRGTTVLVEIETVNGVATAQVTLLRDADGSVGRVELYDLAQNLIATITEANASWIISAADGETREVERGNAPNDSDSALIAEAVAAFRSAFGRVGQGGNFVELDNVLRGGTETEPDTPDENDPNLDSNDVIPLPELAPPPEAPPRNDQGQNNQGFDEGRNTVPAPTIILTGEDSGRVVDQGISVTSGQLVAQIAGGQDVLNWTGSAEGRFGTFDIAPSGEWRYTAKPEIVQLDEGQRAVEVFTAQISDDSGQTATRTITITVDGTGQAPVPVTPLSETVARLVEAVGAQVGGKLVAVDPDAGAVLAWSGSAPGEFGSFAITPDGTWSYVAGPGVRALAQGDTATETFVARVTDQTGRSAVQTVTVTITGANVAPVSTTPEGEAEANVIDGTPLLALGLLTAADPDAGAVLDWSGSAEGTYGRFTVQPDGAWTFTGNDLVRTIGAGTTVTESFIATVADEFGATATQTVVVTVQGTNDVPVSTTSDTEAEGTVIDGTTLSASGVLSATDPDSGEVLGWSGSATGTYGSFVVSPDGVWTFTGNDALRTLGAGTSATETFTATVTDEFGATDTQTVVITVEGRNDAPVSTTSAGEAAGAIIDGTPLLALGLLTAADPDAGAVLDWSGSAEGTYGRFTVQPDGAWTFTGNDLVRTIGAGTTVTESFIATVADEFGATATQTVVVTVQGTNDAPVSTTSDTEAEGTVIDGTTLSASGVLSATDPDSGEVLGWSGSATGTYGSFVVSPDGVWTFTGNDALRTLGAGTSATETFTATVTDEFGATDTQTVVITVEGRNDAPVSTTSAGEAAGAIIDGTPLLALGLLTAADPDAGAVLDWSGSAEGTYGRFTVQPDGAWTFTGNDLVRTIGAGTTVTESFIATVADEFGATATQTVVVTVQGTNDVPVSTTSDTEAEGTVIDGTTLSASGVLSATDPDSGEVLGWSGSATGTYGSFVVSPDGVWTFTGNDALRTLGAGTSATETFTATVTDEFGATDTQTVVITVEGRNDAPVSTTSAGEAAGAIIDGTPLLALGLLTAADPDAGAVLDWSGSAEGTYGRFTVQPDGAWTFTGNDLVRTIGAGTTVTESFIATVADEFGATATQTVVVTVQGTNDAPVSTTSDTEAEGTVIDGTTLSASGVLSATDPDSGEVLGWSGSATGTYGSFVVSPDGVWTFTGNDALRTLGAGTSATETFTATVTDEFGATDTQTVVITVEGRNDAPVSTTSAGEAAGAIIDGTPLLALGLLTAADPDAGAVLDWSGSETGTWGRFTVQPDGAWTFTGNDLVRTLAAGATVTETFTATVTDEFGAQGTQTVVVTVQGSNDAPVTRAAEADTTKGSAVTGTLVATDIDAGDVPTFGAGPGGPAHGAVVIAADGRFVYTPDAGFQGIDGFDYTASDGRGGTSTSRVTVAVVAPADAGIGGGEVALEIREAPGALPAGTVTATATPADAPGVNLVIMLDRSGSIGEAGWQEQINRVADALEEMALRFAGSTTSVDVRIVAFATTATSTATFDLTDPSLVSTVRNLTYSGGGTRYAPALALAEAFFDQAPTGETNVLYVVSDGTAETRTLVPALARLTDAATKGYTVQIEAFGVGSQIEFDTLRLFDPTPGQLDGPDALTDAFPATPTFLPELVSLSVELIADGVNRGVIATETSDAVTSGGLVTSLSLADIAGIADLLGTSNRISATAGYDMDGDSAIDTRLFSSSLLAKADTAQTLAGTGGSDLLFGSDMADDLTGAAGNDILIGFDGDDVIRPGAGRDTVLAGAGDDRIVVSSAETTAPGAPSVLDGGTGRDTLDIDFGGDLNGSLFDIVDLRGIEVIDMRNGEANTLHLALSDVLGLSDESDTALEALLGGPVAFGRTILGDATDTLVLEGATRTGSVADETGNTFDIYRFEGGSDVLATLAVDADMAVSTPAAGV